MVDSRGSRVAAGSRIVLLAVSLGLAVGAQAVGDHLEEHFARMGHEGNAPVFIALSPIRFRVA